MVKRWAVGAVACGASNKLVGEYVLGGDRSAYAFAYAPSSELFNHLLFFYVGLLAGENGWFDPEEADGHDDDDDDDENNECRPRYRTSLRDNLGANVWAFRASVLALYGASVALSLGAHAPLPPAARFLVESVVRGPWTVEFSVFLLELFQGRADFRTPLSTWMARRGHAAYLLQNALVFTAPVAMFVYAYNAGRPEDPIVFSPGSTASSTVVPAVPLAVGWLYACLIYSTLCYVGACALGKLPGLARVL